MSGLRRMSTGFDRAEQIILLKLYFVAITIVIERSSTHKITNGHFQAGYAIGSITKRARNARGVTACSMMRWLGPISM